MQTTLQDRNEVLQDLYKERNERYEQLHEELSYLKSNNIAKWSVVARYRDDVRQIDQTIGNIKKALQIR